MANQDQPHCDYVIRRAGESVNGQPISLDGHGDHTKTCGKFARKVPHTYYVKRPMSAISDPVEGFAYRCAHHADAR